MQLTQDPIWQVFPSGQTLEKFEENILKPVHVKNELPEETRKDFQVLQKLLLHSYYEYRFIDIAFSQSAAILEKNLRIVYSNQTELSNKNKNLNELFEWAFSNGLFEIQNKNILDSIRQLRNHKAHNDKPSLFGITVIGLINRALNLVNDLYEDPNLRKARKKDLLEIDTFIQDLTSNGAIIEFGGAKYVLFRIDSIFLNNKSPDPELIIQCWPIFHPSPVKEGLYDVSRPFIFHLTNRSLKNDLLQAVDKESQNTISISKISEESHDIQFKLWQHQIKQANYPDYILSSSTLTQELYMSELKRFYAI